MSQSRRSHSCFFWHFFLNRVAKEVRSLRIRERRSGSHLGCVFLVACRRGCSATRTQPRPCCGHLHVPSVQELALAAVEIFAGFRLCPSSCARKPRRVARLPAICHRQRSIALAANHGHILRCAGHWLCLQWLEQQIEVNIREHEHGYYLTCTSHLHLPPTPPASASHFHFPPTPPTYTSHLHLPLTPLLHLPLPPPTYTSHLHLPHTPPTQYPTPHLHIPRPHGSQTIAEQSPERRL